MHGGDTFQHTVAALQEAALHDSHWGSAGALINELLGVEGHGLAYGDRHMPEGHEVLFARFYFGAERRTDFERTYFAEYWRRDETIPHIRKLGDGEFLRIADLYTDSEKKSSVFYNDFLRETRGQNGLRVRWDGPSGWSAVLSLADPVGPEQWSSDQIRTIEALGPHIRSCLRVRTVLADAQALGQSRAELLESTRLGIIQLDRRGRIVEANDWARALLRAEDGLSGRNGVLTCLDYSENAELAHLLVRAIAPFGIERIGGSMVISRSAGRPPLRCEIHPTQPVDTDCLAWDVAAMVLVHDLAGRSRVDPEFLSAVLGLTSAQSRVAVALADGRSPTDIALAAGRSEGTVRHHLKQIFRALRINRQAELVRRVLAVGDLPRSRRQASGRPGLMHDGAAAVPRSPLVFDAEAAGEEEAAQL